MGTHVIKMPDIGEGIAQVELVEWFVKVGDEVTEDQVLADVMTDKATVQIPSPVGGTVLALGTEAGMTVAVGSELIRLQVEGNGNHAEAPAAVAASEAVATPTSSTVVPAAPDAPAQRPLASPAVRQRAREAGIDLATLQGQGPDGRIEQRDLQAALDAASPAAQATAGSIERIAVKGLRRAIAERMQEATRRAAHFSYVEEVDVTALEALRGELNQRYANARGHLTLLPLLIRAMVLALREQPQLNARYDDAAQVIERHSAVHVGIATQGDHGLLVPVLRDAQAASLWQNAQALATLTQAARSGQAARDTLSGSTITLTSLGALGGIASTPVLNLPEVAIVGVNRIMTLPRVIDGQIVVRKVMNLSSSFDHRVVDGMDAARFIQALRQCLEQPSCLLLD